ncbi:hypothetical protein QLX08_001309 [Tetragonisca angustula]|uniref:Uncharacterized protein n=1 Tax=Tetragonisca angustula TaxID=166442 RepID=A0AAW1AFX0_9HYME
MDNLSNSSLASTLTSCLL